MQPSTPVTPERIFQIMSAYQQSAALKSAIELEIFTKIAEGNKTAAEIAQASETAERGIRILCDTMTVMGFLTKTDGKYDLNETSNTFLNRHSPAYLGDAIFFMMSDKQLEGFSNLTQAVRNGGSVVTEEGSVDPESPMWVKFAKGMMPMMFLSAQVIAENLGFESDRKLKVLDIAAGHGIFGIKVAEKYPNAEIYAVDWANVLRVATEHAQQFGVVNRHHTIAGSAFEVEFGDGYDVVLLTNFLHHFDKATCESLLKKIHQSLRDDGKVITLEFIPNDDRVSPPTEAMFSLIMLAATPAGDAYTFAELREMFENTGFSRNEHIPLNQMPQHLVVSMK
ncbi:MAG TPA: class I SAM-dependent methyltransferase [Pyrinomonadaceae bacterium]|nr:class I SAM-dependent methyltransferase [Pyrinomonadaceae bacterium]